MSEETGAIPGGEVVSYAVDSTEPMTVEEAARSLTDGRNKAIAKINEPPAESAEEATAEEELPDEGDAAPAEEQAHGEDQEPDPAKEPLIERPKSWTESEDAEWRATPRALQQKIVARELERDTALRRTQNDAAEKLKGLTAKEQQAEQKVQQYEAKLAEQMQTLLEFNNQQFSNIKSQADVDFLANEALRLSQSGDPVLAGQYTAYLNAWQAHQQNMAGKKVELDQVEERKAQLTQRESRERKAREHSLLIEKAPEFADAKKLAEAQTAAAKLFRDSGYGDDELAELANSPILDDHRLQLIINDAMKYRAVKATPPIAVDRKVPSVQRPGASKPANSGAASQIQALEKQLSSASGDKAARISAEIWRLERKTARAG